MNSEMQKRLYEMEVTPPAAVWEKLSINIDQFNADNIVANKVLSAELTPPAGIWEKIDSTINVAEKGSPQKTTPTIRLRTMALAAIFIGVIVTAWIILRNNNQQSSGLAAEDAVENKTATDTGSAQPAINSPDQNTLPQGPTISLSASIPTAKTKRKNTATRNHNYIAYQPVKAGFASLNTTRVEKNFDLPIDDLSHVTSDQHYFTMINANGRLVKIPAQLASLAPHLQDKPISEDIYEVMFGEGAYWKETLNEWRKKVASVPVAPGDAFTSFVEMLKTIQEK